MKQISLIANSGLQFFSDEIIFDPSEPVEVAGRQLPQLTFIDYAIAPDKNRLSLAFKNGDTVYTLSELSDNNCLKQRMTADGRLIDELDNAGMQVVDTSKINPKMMHAEDADTCYSEQTIEGRFQLYDPQTGENYTPFEKILGKWIPAPMFFCDTADNSKLACPGQWCRLRITLIEKLKKGGRYRMEWAFDTTTMEAPNLRIPAEADRAELPFFNSNDHQSTFALANRVGHLLTFTDSHKPLMDYFGGLIFGAQNSTDFKLPSGKIARCRHMAYYIALFTNLRALGAFPKVTLYNSDDKTVKVDLVLDVGNSRTCGLFVEREDFTRATLMSLRDMSNPYRKYDGSFDMRLAFHRAEFGDGNMGVETFRYKSLLRIGEEAKWLIANSAKPTGQSAILMHHSSPKRYLWDGKHSKSQWEFLQLEDANTLIQTNGATIKELNSQLNPDGTFRTSDSMMSYDNSVRYSRRTLMTFVFIEIFQQAQSQINSYEYINHIGDIDCKRVLSNIIITCPTAMPEAEQKVLRQCAIDAMAAIVRATEPDFYLEPYDPTEWEPMIHVLPQPSKIGSGFADPKEKDWSYDEASCCQYVYLYSEIVDKYKGNCDKFFTNVGHVRSELAADGYNRPSLTVGSVDIGAGTTDLMICTYKYNQYPGGAELTPVPLFWDSFYVAGDDILNEIVRRIVLYNDQSTDFVEGYGPLCSHLTARLLRQQPQPVSEERERIVREQAYSMIMDFFSKDNNNMSQEDRRMRNDFNTQISVPIAQKMLDMMKNGESAQDLSYEQIFTDNRPSHFLLEYVQSKFGLDITTLRWSYSPALVTECICTRMERLLKQLSIILDAYNCDVVLLAGRPMSLEPVTDLFLKYFPVAPNRLVRMLPKNDNAKSLEQMHNCYKVGTWFPSHDSTGYFSDLKPIVATGAYVGYLASNNKIDQMKFNMTEMKRRMCSTAEYMGPYDSSNNILMTADIALSPENSSKSLTVHFLPYYIVTKQINTAYYEARPIYCLSLRDDVNISSEYNLSQIKISISRQYKINKEELTLQSAIDRNGNDCTALLELREQSLILKNGRDEFWLDNGVIFD